MRISKSVQRTGLSFQVYMLAVLFCHYPKEDGRNNWACSSMCVLNCKACFLSCIPAKQTSQNQMWKHHTGNKESFFHWRARIRKVGVSWGHWTELSSDDGKVAMGMHGTIYMPSNVQWQQSDIGRTDLMFKDHFMRALGWWHTDLDSYRELRQKNVLSRFYTAISMCYGDRSRDTFKNVSILLWASHDHT